MDLELDLEARLLEVLEADIDANRLILPSLPAVALEARRVAQNPECSLKELAAVIARDPALAARLMKVANSVALRGRHPVQHVKGAIQRLGLRQVSSLVNGLAILQSFQSGHAGTQQLLNEILEHSLEVAVLSHALAAEYTTLDAEEALLAGLIHDIGKLPLVRRASDMPEFYNRLELVRRPCYDLHTRVGTEVLAKWEFSPEMVAVAREHEELMRLGGPRADLVDVVIVANLLAKSDGDDAFRTHSEWGSVPAVRKLGIAANPTPVSEARYGYARGLLGG